MLDEPGVAELADVAGKQRGHELALAEDAHEPPVAGGDGQCGQAAVDDGADRVADLVLLTQDGRLADEIVAELIGVHERRPQR
jgi:hypothetical protein